MRNNIKEIGISYLFFTTISIIVTFLILIFSDYIKFGLNKELFGAVYMFTGGHIYGSIIYVNQNIPLTMMNIITIQIINLLGIIGIGSIVKKTKLIRYTLVLSLFLTLIGLIFLSYFGLGV